jgi:hypothetical protein
MIEPPTIGMPTAHNQLDPGIASPDLNPVSFDNRTDLQLLQRTVIS